MRRLIPFTKIAASVLSRAIRNPALRGELARFLEPQIPQISHLIADKALKSGVMLGFKDLPVETQLHFIRKGLKAGKIGKKVKPPKLTFREIGTSAQSSA